MKNKVTTLGVACAACALGAVVLLGLTSSIAGQQKSKQPATSAQLEKLGKDKAKAQTSLALSDRLTSADPLDKLHPNQSGPRSHFKAYPFKMIAGKSYTIDMTKSGAMNDPYLRLEDSTGTQAAYDDDSGGNRNARITFHCTKTDTYKIIASTRVARDVGEFVLRAALSGEAVSPGLVKMMGGISEFGDIVISRQPLATQTGGTSSQEHSHGYLEYRFTIKNLSDTDKHRVTLTVPHDQSGGPGWGSWIRSLRRSVEVGPKSTAPISLFVPEAPSFQGGVAGVEIDGVVQRNGVAGVDARGSGGIYYGPGGSGGNMLNILAFGDIALPLQNNVRNSGSAAALRPGRRSTGSFTMGLPKGGMITYNQVHRFFAGLDTLKSWSKNWVGYSFYDGIVLPGGELDEAPPDVKAALWQYVECGGSLLVIGPTRGLPENWQPAGQAAKGFTSYYPGLGQCLVTDQTRIDQWSTEQWKPVVQMWERTALPFDQSRSASDAQAVFPVVESMGIPVRGLFILMLVFALCIGPVNLYILSRKKRRIWLLWTVPVFSLLTCMAVFAVMVISEGWYGHVRTEGLTVLDETSQRASTIGWQGFYAPMTPGGGLHYSYETELTPQLGQNRGFYRSGSGTPRTIDWTEDQHLNSGWVTARVPAHFQVRIGEKRLERIIVRKDGTPTLVNGLKAGIEKLWLADRAGNVYLAAAVSPGAEVVLKPEPGRKAAGKPGALRELFTSDWPRLVGMVEANPLNYLRPGTYVAILDDTVFFEKGLQQAQSRKGRSIVYGVMKEPL